ncbi:MAG: hypothetical protein AB7H93_16750 [Vicinamibacterales bacterium]
MTTATAIVERFVGRYGRPIVEPADEAPPLYRVHYSAASREDGVIYLGADDLRRWVWVTFKVVPSGSVLRNALSTLHALAEPRTAAQLAEERQMEPSPKKAKRPRSR